MHKWLLLCGLLLAVGVARVWGAEESVTDIVTTPATETDVAATPGDAPATDPPLSGALSLAMGWSDELGVSFSFDRVGRGGNHEFKALGWGGFFAFNPEPSDTNSYECPHDDYSEVDTYRNFTIGGYLVGSIPLTHYLSVRGLAGLCVGDKTEVVESNATGWYYEESSSYACDLFTGYGLRISPSGDDFALGVDYDTLRGVSVAITSGW